MTEKGQPKLNKTVFIYVYNTIICLFVLAAHFRSFVPPPLASSQTLFFLAGKHHFYKQRHAPYVKLKKQVGRSVTLTGQLPSRG